MRSGEAIPLLTVPPGTVIENGHGLLSLLIREPGQEPYIFSVVKLEAGRVTTLKVSADPTMTISYK